MRPVGKDTTGKIIYHGLPLSDLLFHMYERDGLPDFLQLIRDVEKAGRPWNRCLETMEAAVRTASLLVSSSWKEKRNSYHG